jgi:hypothetical protein
MAGTGRRAASTSMAKIPFPETAEHWVKRAERVRIQAEQANDPLSDQRLLVALCALPHGWAGCFGTKFHRKMKHMARPPGIEKLNRENEIMVFSNPQKIDQAWTGLAHEKIATGPHTSATF